MSIEDSGLAESLAYKFEKSIKDIYGIAHTRRTVFVFKDGSKLEFDISPKTVALANGPENSDAKKFASSVKNFSILANGYEFLFVDGSKLSHKLEGMVMSQPKPSK